MKDFVEDKPSKLFLSKQKVFSSSSRLPNYLLLSPYRSNTVTFLPIAAALLDWHSMVFSLASSLARSAT